MNMKVCLQGSSGDILRIYICLNHSGKIKTDSGSLFDKEDARSLLEGENVSVLLSDKS